MTSVKIRRGVAVPLVLLVLFFVALFISGTQNDMALQLKQYGLTYSNAEMYDDEGDTSAELIAEYVGSDDPVDDDFKGASKEEELKIASKNGGERPIFQVPPKAYPKVAAPEKGKVGKDFSFRIYSHNIKNGAHTDLVPGEEPWKKRKSHVISSMKAHTPANSIIALQEPVKFQLDDIMRALNRYSKETPEWTAYGGGRIDGADEGEFVPIIVRNSEWEVVFFDTFWLNQNDERSSYTGWDGKYPRISTYVTLKHRHTGNHVNVFNTHFDHRGRYARMQSASLLMAKMDSINSWPSFLVGDLNAVPNDVSYKILAQQYADTHTLVNSENRYGHHEWTVTGFSGQFAADAKRIDYIFSPAYVKKEWEDVCKSGGSFDVRLKGYGLMHSKFGGVYMSDHRPLVADFEFCRC